VTGAESQISGFFARYDPATAKLGRAVRARLRKRLPGLLELVYVYERQNSLVISYSPTETGSQGVCALALYPGRVHLCFVGGVRLSKADPKRLLQGRGKAVRHVVLSSLADFDRVEIEVLMASALEHARLRLDENATGSVVIKAAEQRQRAERARRTARPTPRRRTAKAGR
jgi:hypothetical protein